MTRCTDRIRDKVVRQGTNVNKSITETLPWFSHITRNEIDGYQQELFSVMLLEKEVKEDKEVAR